MKYYVSWVQWKAFVKVDNMKRREISDRELWYNTNQNEPIYRKVPRTKQKPLLTEFLKKNEHSIWQEAHVSENPVEIIYDYPNF